MRVNNKVLQNYSLFNWTLYNLLILDSNSIVIAYFINKSIALRLFNVDLKRKQISYLKLDKIVKSNARLIKRNILDRKNSKCLQFAA